MIRKIKKEDIPVCAEILCAVYNNELWQCRWEQETACAYLADYFAGNKFVGFLLEEDGRILGALFAHEVICWNNSELHIDEMFVQPDLQRKGYGSMLIKAAEEYIHARKLAGFTLSTNKYAPAPDFYRKNGFVDCPPVLFMYKVIDTNENTEKEQEI